MKRHKARFAEHLDSLTYSSILTWWFVNILLFALIYFFLSRIPGNGPAELAGELEDLAPQLDGALVQGAGPWGLNQLHREPFRRDVAVRV